jgi:hypothetical protein
VACLNRGSVCVCVCAAELLVVGERVHSVVVRICEDPQAQDRSGECATWTAVPLGALCSKPCLLAAEASGHLKGGSHAVHIHRERM